MSKVIEGEFCRPVDGRPSCHTCGSALPAATVSDPCVVALLCGTCGAACLTNASERLADAFLAGYRARRLEGSSGWTFDGLEIDNEVESEALLAWRMSGAVAK